MLLNCPGKTIRLFIAKPGHDLHQNCENTPLSIGFHAHHCELTLQPLFGTVVNWRISLRREGKMGLWAYKYKSAIATGNSASFRRIGEVKAETVVRELVEPNEAVFLNANEIHTVYVPEGEAAAWFVYEGREDATYDSISYSNVDLELFDFSPLYVKPTDREIKTLLAECGL